MTLSELISTLEECEIYCALCESRQPLQATATDDTSVDLRCGRCGHVEAVVALASPAVQREEEGDS